MSEPEQWTIRVCEDHRVQDCALCSVFDVLRVVAVKPGARAWTLHFYPKVDCGFFHAAHVCNWPSVCTAFAALGGTRLVIEVAVGDVIEAEIAAKIEAQIEALKPFEGVCR